MLFPSVMSLCPRLVTSRYTLKSHTLQIILRYAPSIHRLRETPMRKVILNTGGQEFTFGLLLERTTMTKNFDGASARARALLPILQL